MRYGFTIKWPPYSPPYSNLYTVFYIFNIRVKTTGGGGGFAYQGPRIEEESKNQGISIHLTISMNQS